MTWKSKGAHVYKTVDIEENQTWFFHDDGHWNTNTLSVSKINQANVKPFMESRRYQPMTKENDIITSNSATKV